MAFAGSGRVLLRGCGEGGSIYSPRLDWKKIHAKGFGARSWEVGPLGLEPGGRPRTRLKLQAVEASAVLAQSPLFRGLESTDLVALAAEARFRSLAKGQTLFLQGDPVDALYLVARGLIKVYRFDPKGGRQVVLHLEGPHQAVAAVAVFLEQPYYPASAEALEDTLVLSIPREAFDRLVDTRASLARALIRFLAKRQSQLVHLLDRLVFAEVGSRLAEYLLQRAEAEGPGFRLPTNPELAALLGTVPEAVSRKLGQFFREGLIEVKKRQVWVLDASALREIAEG